MTKVVDDSPEPVTTGRGGHHPHEHLRWYQEPATEHPAATVLLVALIVAFPLLVFGAGSQRWFYGDEWDFLVARSAGNLGDLLRPHNENLSTVPILVYRALFNVFHLNSYTPYVALVVLTHLAVVGLLWVIMRRCGVNQWVALLPALVLLSFGSGYEDIVWAFQMAYTGALALGLVQLLVADHDGPIDRRDGWALAAGFAALLCSGIGVTTVVVVGVACLIRRGWRPAALQTVPLGLFYVVWAVFAKPSGPGNPFHASNAHVAGRVVDWDLAAARHTFVDLGHFALVGVALGVLLVGGLWLAFRPVGLDGIRRRYSMIVALLVGAVVFASITGYGRWFWGSDYSSQARYVYLCAAFVLPGLGVAADAVIRRWRPMIPVVVLLFAIGVPSNIDAFNHMFPTSTYPASAEQHLAGIGQSPLAPEVDQSTLTEPASFPFLTVAWLTHAVRQGWLPSTPVPPSVRAQMPLELGVAQSQVVRPDGGRCQDVATPLTLELPKGSIFWVQQPHPSVIGFLPRFSIQLLDGAGKTTTPARAFDPVYGNHFTVELPGLRMKVVPQAPVASVFWVPLTLCHQ